MYYILLTQLYFSKYLYFRLNKCIVMRHETNPKYTYKVIKNHLQCHLLYKGDLALLKLNSLWDFKQKT